MTSILHPLSFAPSHLSSHSNASSESLASADSYSSASSISPKLLHLGSLADYPPGGRALASLLVEYSEKSADGEQRADFAQWAFDQVAGSGLEIDAVAPRSFTYVLFSSPAVLLVDLAQHQLRSVYHVVSAQGRFTLHIIERPPFVFPLLEPNAKNNVPTMADWERLWKAWDLVTLGMIPKEMLLQKPIDLRHKCLFYIGHIPTFLDMMLVKTLGGEPSEPKFFWDIFERGIDPHVDDPDHCHNHSVVPEKDEDWPTLDTIMVFRDRVRARLIKLYSEVESGEREMSVAIARTLVMTHEHEAFHVETLLYMLIQRAGTGTIPPPNFTPPPFHQLPSAVSPTLPLPVLGATTLAIGHDDCEALDASSSNLDREFGWDNESPARTVSVDGRFKAEWRCVTNGEFEAFWKGTGRGLVGLPKSWVAEGNDIKVRTVFGPIPLDQARDWPVQTSYDDLLTYAKSKGGRLPTEPELRLFLDTYDIGADGNVGFRNWNPLPGTMGMSENNGRGSNGGVWEWTSTKFDTHEGLSPTNLFVGYSTDFFDTKHHVVLGSSYATLPRLTRRTLRNFYQHNYPYAWVGGRVVYDM